MNKLAKYILNELKSNLGVGDFWVPLLFNEPIRISSAMWEKIDFQKNLISDFYDTVVSIARQALRENDESILNLLFSESVAGMTLNYHRNLPDFCWKKPIFIRTDQSVSGQIYEIQPPGSGWGDIPLISKALAACGHSIPESVRKYTDRYSQCIINTTGHSSPQVFHMLDSASAPAGMRYLFTQTYPKLRYWGVDSKVSMHKADYVTAHSPVALTASNYFNLYMKNASDGKLVFGISPNLLFDQKAIYILPFYRETKDLFSDEIRSIFPFTSFIENNGFWDERGSFIKLCDFIESPKSAKRYFLKYGGADLSKNWGSREVYRLDAFTRKGLKKTLDNINQLVKKGEIWIVQKDVSRISVDAVSTYLPTVMNLDDMIKMHIKMSAFYGDDGCIGVKLMARKHYKVHGQPDTIVGICI